MFGIDVLLRTGSAMLIALVVTSLATNIKKPTTLEPPTTEPPKCPTCLKVNTTCYNATFLLDLVAPFRSQVVISKLGILHSTNTLFFNFEPTIDDPEYSKIGFINLDNPGNASVISNKEYVMNFEAFDIDQDNALVYLGGSDGIYVLDTKMNRMMPFSSRGDTVRSLFYKGNVYFVRYGEFKIVRKKNDNFDILVDGKSVTKFVINKYNVIVYLCNYGLFAKRNDEEVRLSNNPFIRGLTIDLDDVIYAWWVDGIYKVIIENIFVRSQMVKVADLPSIGGLTFDNTNNFVFTYGSGLFKLLQTDASNC